MVKFGTGKMTQTVNKSTNSGCDVLQECRRWLERLDNKEFLKEMNGKP